MATKKPPIDEQRSKQRSKIRQAAVAIVAARGVRNVATVKKISDLRSRAIAMREAREAQDAKRVVIDVPEAVEVVVTVEEVTS